jgi:hypothetical protein
MTTQTERMCDAINGARLVCANADLGVALVWSGGCTVNAYELPDWREFNCRTFGHELRNGSPQLAVLAEECVNEWFREMVEENNAGA